jgi:hypothetical protein
MPLWKILKNKLNRVKVKPKYLELTPEDQDKVNKARAKDDAKLKVDEEQLFIAEFGKHFGWAGVEAILDNKIDGETAAWLLQGARKVDYQSVYNAARAALIGSGAAQSKKPSDAFRRATKDLVKAMKADI